MNKEITITLTDVQVLTILDALEEYKSKMEDRMLEIKGYYESRMNRADNTFLYVEAETKSFLEGYER